MDKEKDSEEKEEEIEKPSYTYWKRESDMKADHKGFTPQQTNQKVDENPVLGIKQELGKKKNN